MTQNTPSREAITRVADRMFAEHGADEVSLRQIVLESGQRNMSAVQYHFGNREGLLEAVFERRMTKLGDARAECLAEIDRNGEGDNVRALVVAAVTPLANYVRNAPAGSDYARFAARMTPRVDFASDSKKDIGSANREIIVRLRRALHHVPPQVAADRVDLAMNMLVSAFAAYEQRQEEGLASAHASLDAIAGSLIDMLVAGLLAPVGSAEPA